MKRVMTDEQRLFFEANGYLVVPNLLSPEELGRIRAAADHAEAEWRADPARPGVRSDQQNVVHAIIEYHPIFLDLLEHPTVFPIARELLGDDIAMIDNDYILTYPTKGPWTQRWHFDEGFPGVYSPRSTMMVKVFYVLDDVPSDGGPTAFIPGSHRFPMDFPMPSPDDIASMPGHVRMDVPVGSAYLFSGRIYHAALPNRSPKTRRVLIFNYGHVWMKPWQGYEPSERLRAAAATPIRKQLLHAVPAYGSLLKE